MDGLYMIMNHSVCHKVSDDYSLLRKCCFVGNKQRTIRQVSMVTKKNSVQWCNMAEAYKIQQKKRNILEIRLCGISAIFALTMSEQWTPCWVHWSELTRFILGFWLGHASAFWMKFHSLISLIISHPIGSLYLQLWLWSFDDVFCNN